MREDGELGATNSRINRWLKGVETAKNEGTLYGREEDKSVSSNICRNVLNAYYQHTVQKNYLSLNLVKQVQIFFSMSNNFCV